MRLALAGTALALVICGCSHDQGAGAQTRAAFVPVKQCPTTSPSGFPEQGFNHGNASIGVALWPNGRLPAGMLPDGGTYAVINDDGSIRAKLGWWRVVHGRLRISGTRLDAQAPPLRADVPDGYGDFGFQATEITFPTSGCWRVTGRVANSAITFVVQVLT